jgi:CreA protein
LISSIQPGPLGAFFDPVGLQGSIKPAGRTAGRRGYATPFGRWSAVRKGNARPPAIPRLGSPLQPAKEGAISALGRRRCRVGEIMSEYLLRSVFLALLVGFLAHALQLRATYAADEPDLIFKRSTVFKWVTPNDKLATYGLDDPDVEGVACHFTVPERGGLTGWIGVAEEVSDISLACRQVGPIHFKKKFSQGEDMFRQRRSLFFKRMQIVRGCDTKRNVLVYMVYSDKLIEGSPKNSTSSVPVMPWGTDGQVEKCADWIEH